MIVLDIDDLYEETGVGTDFVTPSWESTRCFYQSFQILKTSTLAGTINLQASLDNVNFVNVVDPLLPITVLAATTNVVLENYNACAPFYRIAFTFTSGSGDVSIRMYAKGGT